MKFANYQIKASRTLRSLQFFYKIDMNHNVHSIDQLGIMYKLIWINQNNFFYRLMENINEKDPVWKQNGTQFVDSVTKLLERLLDYRSVMQVMFTKTKEVYFDVKN